MTKVIRYSSNNSGGSWWLSDDDWKALEKAGWAVNWKEERWLRALATSAHRVGLSYDEAVAEFERVTGQCADSAGCACCGQPHYFYEDEINE